MARWELLLDQFVASFEKLDDMSVLEGLDPIAAQLAVGEPDGWGRRHWRPSRVAPARALLEPVYAKMPAKFPLLFEDLVLSYRWAEADLKLFRLLPNPPGSNLKGLLEAMSGDRAVWSALLPAGFIQFGKGPDMDYDPVCFDISSTNKNRECRVVKIDHEEILCNNRVKIVSELAPSFESLVLKTIEQTTEV